MKFVAALLKTDIETDLFDYFHAAYDDTNYELNNFGIYSLKDNTPHANPKVSRSLPHLQVYHFKARDGRLKHGRINEIKLFYAPYRTPIAVGAEFFPQESPEGDEFSPQVAKNYGNIIIPPKDILLERRLVQLCNKISDNVAEDFTKNIFKHKHLH